MLIRGTVALGCNCSHHGSAIIEPILHRRLYGEVGFLPARHTIFFLSIVRACQQVVAARPGFAGSPSMFLHNLDGL